jgi:hypothetical protein
MMKKTVFGLMAAVGGGTSGNSAPNAGRMLTLILIFTEE